MRKFLIASLNIAGILLLALAGVLAWNAYSPITPPLPADAIVVDQGSPDVELPPRAATSVPTPGGEAAPTAVPAILPETKLRPPLFTPEPDERNQQQQARREARKTQAEMEAMRSQTFPSPAKSVPTRLLLPSIEVDSPIVEVGSNLTEQDGQMVTEWEVADFAVGYHKGSALPGEPGNTVMAGHNNIGGEVFRNLSAMKVGDEVFVLVGEISYRYVVERKLLLKDKGVSLEQRIKNAAWIAPTADVRLTLVSCWPYTSNIYRVIIVAKPG